MSRSEALSQTERGGSPDLEVDSQLIERAVAVLRPEATDGKIAVAEAKAIFQRLREARLASVAAEVVELEEARESFTVAELDALIAWVAPYSETDIELMRRGIEVLKSETTEWPSLHEAKLIFQRLRDQKLDSEGTATESSGEDLTVAELNFLIDWVVEQTMEAMFEEPHSRSLFFQRVSNF